MTTASYLLPPSSPGDGPWQPIRPVGLAAVLLAVTVVFTAVSVVVVALRLWMRVRSRCLGPEDWFMGVGLALFLAHNGTVAYGTATGVGAREAALPPVTAREAHKVVTLWQLLYLWTSVFVKASICATLVRISVRRAHTVLLGGLVAVSVVGSLAASLVLALRCRPLAASWDPARGACHNPELVVVFTYLMSALNIVTDTAVALVPIHLLWDVQMPPRVKMLSWLILGIGVLASIATIIRMPYCSAYQHPETILYNVGNLILWSVVECGLGIIAGSLPMLRKLFRSLRQESAASRQRTAAAKAAAKAAVAAAQRHRQQRQRSWLLPGCGCHPPTPTTPPPLHRPGPTGRVPGLHNAVYDAEFETVVVGGGGGRHRHCRRCNNHNDDGDHGEGEDDDDDDDDDRDAGGGFFDYSSSSNNAAAAADDVASTHRMIRVTREWQQTESPAVVGNMKK